MSNSLIQHIEALNEKTLAWIAESPETCFAGLYSTDLSRWAENGVTDVASFEHYNLACNVYDAHKEIWGFKPSWKNLMEMSQKELEAEYRSICEEANRLNNPHNY